MSAFDPLQTFEPPLRCLWESERGVATDFCSYLRERVGERLSALGFQEAECRQFGQELTGHGQMFADQVAFYGRKGQLIAISYSPGNGPSCWVGHDGMDLAAHDQWPSLWHTLGMDAGVNLDDPTEADWEWLGEWLDEMPDGLDANVDLIVMKLAELPAG